MTDERTRRDALRALTGRIAAVRGTETSLVQRASAAAARHQSALEARERLTAELAEADAQCRRGGTGNRAALPDPTLDTARPSQSCGRRLAPCASTSV